MKFGQILWIAFVEALATLTATSGTDLTLGSGTTVRFADEHEASAELRRIDAFTQALSPFDRAARLKSAQAISTDEFLEFAAKQALPWQPGEIKRLDPVIRSMSAKLTNFALSLPATVRLIKTTGLEEGQAAYCRGNCIVLPTARLKSIGPSLERLLIHELFHILSRNDRDLRDRLYAIIGFKPCGEIPSESLNRLRITNPDAPTMEHGIVVTVENEPLTVVPVLFSRSESYSPKEGGEFFAYLTFKLMVIEQRQGRWKPAGYGSKPRLLDVKEVSGFHEQIGENTQYIIHPEEILADNFALLVTGEGNIPTPRIIREMRRILSTPAP